MQSVRVPAKYEYLAQISEFVAEAAQDADLDKVAIYAVQLAIDEACSNIMEHAYQGKGQGEIICTCEITDYGLKVILNDRGRPLNPEDVPEFDLDATLEELETGGAGIYLMHQLMDQVHYETDPQLGNKLELVKRKEKKQE
jgi:serine/threonine-protein kinase RsbW